MKNGRLFRDPSQIPKPQSFARSALTPALQTAGKGDDQKRPFSSSCSQTLRPKKDREVSPLFPGSFYHTPNSEHPEFSKSLSDSPPLLPLLSELAIQASDGSTSNGGSWKLG
jgi:hypothetical protein